MIVICKWLERKLCIGKLFTELSKLPKEAFAGIEITNTELPRLFDEDKKGILDIKAKLTYGKQIGIEIQVLPASFMPERSMYYWAKMYTTQTKAGDTFNALKKCIAINIVDYEFLPMEKMHTCYHLAEDETGHRLTDVLEVHFCELKKLRSGMKISDGDDPSLDWMRFIGAKTKGEMEMLSQNNETIKDAFDYLQVISKDKEKRMAYEARELWLMDQRTREEVAREEGKEIGIQVGKKEGIQVGRQEEKVEIVKNLRAMGMSTSDIAKATGLMVEQVEKLK